VKNLKKITKMTSTNQSEKTNKRKIAMLTIFLVVLCILGLSTILPVRSIDSSVTMKDVAIVFNGNNAGTVSITSVSDWNQAFSPVTGVDQLSPTSYATDYVLPVDTYFTVDYTYTADPSGLLLGQSGTASFTTGDSGSLSLFANIAVSYTMQVTPIKT
jgi:hypothetical protein